MSARLTIPNKVVKPKEEKSELRTYLLQASLLPGNVVVEGTIQHIKHDNSFKVRLVTGRGGGWWGWRRIEIVRGWGRKKVLKGMGILEKSLLGRGGGEGWGDGDIGLS